MVRSLLLRTNVYGERKYVAFRITGLAGLFQHRGLPLVMVLYDKA